MLDWLGGNKPSEPEDSANDNRPRTFILMEIVSARDLQHKRTLFDREVDPYCVVRFNKNEEIIHMTSTIYNDADPIWSVKTNGLCLVEIPLNEDGGEDTAASDDAVVVEVCHGSQCLGIVTVPFVKVLESDGERQEYPICKNEGGDTSSDDETNSRV